MSLSEVLCVCVAVSLFPAIFTQSAMSRHQLELKEHYEHLAKIAEFQCDQPQPRLLHVNELMSETQLYGKAYFPEVTVMHRCDRHVGSCNDGAHKCGPTFATTVQMPFKATYLEDMGDHKKGEWEMEYHPMENHTSCGCLKYEEPPAPPKTTVHYHYVDPSLPVPPQNFLPLDPSSQNAPGTASSYDVSIYQFNNTSPQPLNNEYDQEQNQPERNNSRLSINEVTKLPEEEDRPKPEEEYKPKPGEEEDKSEPEDDRDGLCAACIGPQQYPGYPGNAGYPGYTSSESSTESDVRDPSSLPEALSNTDEQNDTKAQTLDKELIRFGGGEFRAVDSPYLTPSFP